MTTLLQSLVDVCFHAELSTVLVFFAAGPLAGCFLPQPRATAFGIA
jgi:hypothetical protein